MTAAESAVTGLDLKRNDEDDLFDAVLTGSVDQEKSLPSNTDEVKTDDIEKPNSPPESNNTTPSKRQGVYIGKFSWWITQEDITHLLHKVGVRDIIEIIFAEKKVNGLSKGFVKVVVNSEGSGRLLLDKIPKCKLGGETITCHPADQFDCSLFEDMSSQNAPGFPLHTDSSNTNESYSFLSQNPLESTMPEQFLNQFTNTFPSVPDPFLRYPASFLPHMPPPPMQPMFLDFLKSSQDQNLDCAVAGTSQRNCNNILHSDERTDKEYEDLINRNRAVASAAINKAVTGATTGDLKVAMETLLTAISIIKQSRVYQDDRCQALVTSLKDCLMSIQGGYRNSRHSEERECNRRKSSSSERRRSSRGERVQSHSRERSRGRSGGRCKERSQDWDRHRHRHGNRERNHNRYY